MSAGQLTFMPPLGSTETLYSVCAALHHLRGGINWKQAGRYYFNDEDASLHRQLPCSLDHFCEVTRNLLGSPETIVKERTLLGFYIRFMDAPEFDDWIALAKGRRPKFFKLAEPDTKKLKLCPECVIEDRKVLGRGTWRLEHHLPGAKVCMHHGRDLQQVVKNNYHLFRHWMRPEDFVGNQPLLRHVEMTSERASLVSLARILWILKTHRRVSPTMLRHIFAQKLTSLGVLKAPRFLNSKQVACWFETGPNVDMQYSLVLESGIHALRGNWLTFLDGRCANHPLRWAILLSACMSFEELNLELEKASPLQATLSGNWGIAGKIHEDLLPTFVWDALLEGMETREVSSHWGFAPASLNRALRLNPQLKAIREARIEKDFLQPKRAWVLRSLRDNPNVTLAKLRRQDSASIRWLSHHDREWLKQHIPLVKSGRLPQMSLFPN